MKIAVKAKPEPVEQLNIRVPASLKRQMEATRKLADECGVDYNATLIGMLVNFNPRAHSLGGLLHPRTPANTDHGSPPGDL